MRKGRIPRRGFLTRLAGGGAAAMGLGAAGALGAAERIRLGIVGFGKRGEELARELLALRDKGEAIAIAAACDVYARRREDAARILKLDRRAVVADSRRLLGRKELDGVVIATPNHLHAPQALEALDAGLDVYCETPMARTAVDAAEMARAVRRLGRVLQVGVDWCSDTRYAEAGERIRRGEIGRPLFAQGSACRNSAVGEWRYIHIRPDASPDTVDWLAFLGPAPRRPWSAERFFQWRLFWDYAGGIAEDLFAPVVARLLLALNAGFPTRATASGGIYAFPDGREVPDTFHAILEYPEGFSIVLVSTLGNDVGIAECVRGHRGTIFFVRDGYELIPQAIAGEQAHAVAASARYRSHLGDWLAAMRTRRAPRCPADLGYRTVAAIEMMVRSFRERRQVAWDAERGRVI